MSTHRRRMALGAIGVGAVVVLGPQNGVLKLQPLGGGTSTPTSAYASAGLGHLTLDSAVILKGDAASFLAGWSDPTVGCRASRRVVVDATLSYAPSGPGSSTKTLRFTRIGEVVNCAEAGPNLGVTVSGAAHGLACANGQWLPGRYTLTTTGIVATSVSAGDATLRSIADLTTTDTTPCA